MKFEKAIASLKDCYERYSECNYCMRLPEWNKDVSIRLQMPDENSKMTHPYLYANSRFGNVPWIPTVVEMFAEDWEVYNVSVIDERRLIT